MTFIQSIFRYVFVACIAMILYCAYNMHRVDVPCSPDDMNGYLFFQLLFSAGAIASYIIIKDEN